jgi:hypothetical protein
MVLTQYVIQDHYSSLVVVGYKLHFINLHIRVDQSINTFIDRYDIILLSMLLCHLDDQVQPYYLLESLL